MPLSRSSSPDASDPLLEPLPNHIITNDGLHTHFQKLHRDIEIPSDNPSQSRVDSSSVCMDPIAIQQVSSKTVGKEQVQTHCARYPESHLNNTAPSASVLNTRDGSLSDNQGRLLSVEVVDDFETDDDVSPHSRYYGNQAAMSIASTRMQTRHNSYFGNTNHDSSHVNSSPLNTNPEHTSYWQRLWTRINTRRSSRNTRSYQQLQGGSPPHQHRQSDAIENNTDSQCSLPMGLLAVYYAANVDALILRGKSGMALHYSCIAKKLVYITAAITLVMYILFFFVLMQLLIPL
ncbi:hypothetical protein BATDEDRAFT_88728 [Batrachochytrium dendrobatidis JAM81]|uniref:Uncharacterized protein n=2 Tax=Batrachochytrium dendrobatidis TaxID=109871 RepID=F4P303_BATDJ|nr:uncharacterized protein BATDEDRAFT_88728 [Batrachochytrium dendrobatidis JAM81]EGF80527.1 hypothetical protein BATDEDRAFT_88728 [Batrachochytrium dendrobatidis JAM81]OAJ40874.1 hypothetical protein BDEG_24565 [Batrachochytrium dendrobatidis JEL423]|eukprot:XP_006679311.1 hypothetical protein BATDEDRAFT_88728 [Batrachochytrium dendrobatidis JAM81]